MLQLGVFQEVVPADSAETALDRALGLAREIAGRPARAVAHIKRLVREALGVRALVHRLRSRASDSVLEQSAIAGALSSEAPIEAAERAAARLNHLVDEGEGRWTGRFDPGHELVLERVVRGVTDRVVLDQLLTSSADARRLADRAAGFGDTIFGRR
jgi:DNA gyrase subunit B